MRGLITLIVMAALFVVAMMVGVPVIDQIAPLAADMAPGFSSQIFGIQDAVVMWSVPIFLATIVLWAVFWILRQERQTVR